MLGEFECSDLTEFFRVSKIRRQVSCASAIPDCP